MKRIQMQYIIFLIILLSIFIRDVSMLSAVVSQISSVGYPDMNNHYPICQDDTEECKCDNCKLCLFEVLRKSDIVFKTVNLATFPLGATTVATFNPPQFNKIIFTKDQAETIKVFVNKCEIGFSSVIQDVFVDAWIDTTFLINCKNCVGTYQGYIMKGTISISDMKILPFRGIRADLSEIQFYSQKFDRFNFDISDFNFDQNRCCVNTKDNNFDGCNFCAFYLHMNVNSKWVDDKNFDMLNSWVIDRNYSYPITIYTSDIQIVPLNLSFFLCFDNTTNFIIDKFINLKVNELPYANNQFTVIGDYKRVKLIFKISSYSINFNGGNSQYEQPNFVEGENMDLNGNRKCADSTQSGKMCDQITSRCTNSNNPCLNGGKCWGTKKAYNCDCPDGFTGKICQLYYCSTPCVNSKCVGPNKCGACNPGWSGNNCQNKTCDNYKICKSGTCEISGDKRICRCFGNATGNFCQFDCSLSCNKGTCKFSNGVFFCVCNKGWYGNVCDRQTVGEEKIFRISTNFFVAIVLIIVIGIIIIISIYILMTKYLKTHIKSDIHMVDLTRSKLTLHPKNTPLTLQNSPAQNIIPQEQREIIDSSGNENQISNYSNNKENENLDSKKTKDFNTIYPNPYSEVQAQETYTYIVNNPILANNAIITDSNKNKSALIKAVLADRNIQKDCENLYLNKAEISNDSYKSVSGQKSEDKTSDNNKHDEELTNL